MWFSTVRKARNAKEGLCTPGGRNRVVEDVAVSASRSLSFRVLFGALPVRDNMEQLG